MLEQACWLTMKFICTFDLPSLDSFDTIISPAALTSEQFERAGRPQHNTAGASKQQGQACHRFMCCRVWHATAASPANKISDSLCLSCWTHAALQVPAGSGGLRTGSNLGDALVADACGGQVWLHGAAGKKQQARQSGQEPTA